MNKVTKEFELCKFGFPLVVKGFDIEGIFVSHLKSIWYPNLAKIFKPWEIEENQRILKLL